jgi:hypothetical protein
MSGVVFGRLGRRLFEPSNFLSHEPAIPTQNRVWCDDACDGGQAAPADDLAFHGQAASLVVGEAQSSRWLRSPEDPVLLK